MELELKYIMVDATAEGVLATVLADGWHITESREISQRDVYYDSPELSVKKAGNSMRLRYCEGEVLFTKKTALTCKDGLFRREEEEYPVSAPPPELDGLGPVLTVDNRRNIYLIEKDGCVVELAFDLVTYRADGKEAGPERQLEVELKSQTDLPALEELAVKLIALPGIIPMTTSKYDRGTALLAVKGSF